MITYRSDLVPDLDQARDLYRACSLGERRPIDDAARFGAMLANAGITITAWDGDLLVGISRSLSDGVWSTYLADLAVRGSHQKFGIGRELIRLTREAAPQATLILLAAPAAVDYYPRLGFHAPPSSWWMKADDVLR